MDTTPKPLSQIDLHLLLMGNNPGELSKMQSSFKVGHSNIITEIAFDIKSLLERLHHFHPSYIVIDDNIGKHELLETIHHLTHFRKTKNVPITVLKNSNFDETGSPDVLDYVMKQTLSPESLITSARNVLKFKRTQQYLRQTYKKRKSELMKLVGR